jgi:hypothetical protein
MPTTTLDAPTGVWGPHHPPLRALPEVATVATPSLRRIRLRLAQAAQDRTLVVITGTAGSGKSYAVGRGAEAVRDDTDTRIVWVELASTISEKALMEDLYIQVTDLMPPKRASTADLRRLLQRTLAEEHRMLIVDEAQHASSMALRNLRWLHDKTTSDFALVIVGTPPLWKKLPPELKSRTAHHVEVSRIADADVAGVLRALHPLFAEIDASLLEVTNRRWARGSFRWWAKFLANALPLAAKAGAPNQDNLELFLSDLDGA